MTDRPNIVLVTFDSLRGDHCGYIDPQRDLTPTMDQMAAEGVAFEAAIAPGPQTFSSMPAIFTGQYRPAETLEDYPGESHWQRRLAAIDSHLETCPSLPQRLQQLGYTTAGISPNPWTSAAAGFNRGFDTFVDLSGEQSSGRIASLLKALPGIDETDRSTKLVVNMLTRHSFFSRWETLYDEIRAARRELSEPYFLWVFLLDTHFPFVTARKHRAEQSLLEMYYTAYRSEKLMRGRTKSGDPPTTVVESLRRAYRDTVRASDAFLDRVHSEFAADDPALILHSDHGESLSEHGNYGHHHRDVYEENIHVPYVVYNAGVSDTVSQPVSLATIADTTVQIAREGTFDPDAMADSFVVARSEGGIRRAVRGRRFKFVETEDEEYLFDLVEGGRERVDQSENHPELLQLLRSHGREFESHTEETRKLTRASNAVAAECEL